jgi:hypothetical protein
MRHHLPWPKPVTSSTTHELSPSPRRCSLAHNTIVLPKPMTPSICSILGPANPSSSQTPWRPRARDAIKTVPPLILQRRCPSRARNVHCIFFFVILGLQILIFICYIATLLWYATLLLFYCISMICYIATYYFCLLHCFDMLHWHLTLMC